MSVELRNCGRHGKCYVTSDGRRFRAPAGVVTLFVCLELARAETPEVFGLRGFIQGMIDGKRDYQGAFRAISDLFPMPHLNALHRLRVNYALIREQWQLQQNERDPSGLQARGQ